MKEIWGVTIVIYITTIINIVFTPSDIVDYSARVEFGQTNTLSISLKASFTLGLMYLLDNSIDLIIFL